VDSVRPSAIPDQIWLVWTSQRFRNRRPRGLVSKSISEAGSHRKQAFKNVPIDQRFSLVPFAFPRIVGIPAEIASLKSRPIDLLTATITIEDDDLMRPGRPKLEHRSGDFCGPRSGSRPADPTIDQSGRCKLPLPSAYLLLGILTWNGSRKITQV
jgi:hypothetical protein